ncbi:MAG TPA: MarC family protein, partial [Elusimicrobiota bacterium]|nr:MarC family protein [Elusimicrobiota bacterium]
FVIAMNDILRSEKAHRTVDSETVGAVPIGVPLITGPAVLTTVLLLTAEHHYVITGPAILLNVLFAGLVFGFAEPIHDFLGKAGTKTISKIAHLLLAAIAVMMVRKGLAQIIATGGFM